MQHQQQEQSGDSIRIADVFPLGTQEVITGLKKLGIDKMIYASNDVQNNHYKKR
jgi:hypothetical protein